MAKVFLGVGHGGKDPGAVGFIKEAAVNLNMALACRDYLENKGIEVKMSRVIDENDPLEEEIKECNAYGPDLAVDIHNNAGGGDGCEVFHHHKGGNSKKLAANINQELINIGQNSRGLKTRLNSKGYDYYGFIRSIKATSVIVEGVFVDNKADSSQADTLSEQKAFGVAIAKGVIKTLEDMGKYKANEISNSNEISVDNDKSKEMDFQPYLVKITANKLNVRNGAGTSYKINAVVSKNEVFTIVDEYNDWGRLKSGAGWISLKYAKRI